MAKPADEEEPLPRVTLAKIQAWLKRSGPDAKAVLVSDEGYDLKVMLSIEEYSAMVAFLKLLNNPKKLAQHRSRLEKIKSGKAVPLDKFLERR